MPEVSMMRRHVRFAMYMLAFALIVVALARPQMGNGASKQTKKGIELEIALDISNSMLAQDVSPNRLAASKQYIMSLISQMKDDKIGLILFAGEAYTQLPITGDYLSMQMLLEAVEPTMITTQGTDIARAIKLAESSFTQAKGVGRGIVVITDGENHEGGAEEAATEALKKGINTFVVGVGSSEGAPIPDIQRKGSYKTDETGQTVITHLNKEMCISIANAGKGSFIPLDNPNLAAQKTVSRLASLTRKESTVVDYSSYQELFQWPLGLAMLCLAFAASMLDRRNRILGRINLFRRKQ